MSDNFILDVDSGTGNASVAVSCQENKSRTGTKRSVVTGVTDGGAEATLTLVQGDSKAYVVIDGIFRSDDRTHPLDTLPLSGGSYVVTGRSNCRGLYVSHTYQLRGQAGTGFEVISTLDNLTDAEGVRQGNVPAGVVFPDDYGAMGEYTFEFKVTVPVIQNPSSSRVVADHCVFVKDYDSVGLDTLNIQQRN